MSTPIYKNEQSWRAFMLLEGFIVRNALYEVGEIVIAVFILYLISTYSVPAALGLAIALLAFVFWMGRDIAARRQSMISTLEADADLDL